MKRLLEILLLSQITLLVSCVHNETPQEGYIIGTTYKFNNFSIKVELEKENERFIFNFTDEGINFNYYYDVWFKCNDYDVESRSDINQEFKYLYENNKPIVFDKNGFFLIHESIKLFTDYSSANSKIKEAINNDEFISIQFGSKIFTPSKGNNY